MSETQFCQPNTIQHVYSTTKGNFVKVLDLQNDLSYNSMQRSFLRPLYLTLSHSKIQNLKIQQTVQWLYIDALAKLRTIMKDFISTSLI